MSSSMPSPTTPSARQAPTWMLPAFKWLTALNAVLVLVQAFLASQGFWDAKPDLIKGHGQLGNLVILLVVVQAVLGVMLANSGTMPRSVMVLAGLVVVLVVIQLGLGYSTRDNYKLTIWHVTNGVLLMGVSAVVATIAWMRSPTASY